MEEGQFTKSLKQHNILNPYNSDQSSQLNNDPHIIKQGQGLTEKNKKVFYTLDKETCPQLNGALTNVGWGKNPPNVDCTYDINLIKENIQVLEYVKNFGKDMYFNEVIMPKVFTWASNECPVDIYGDHHKVCHKSLEKSEVGRLCREWAKNYSNRAQLLLTSYIENNENNEDCACYNRKNDPFYTGIYKHTLMRGIQPGQWYSPCVKSESYLIPPEIANNKLNKKAANRRVSGALNHFIKQSSNSKDFYEEANAKTKFDVKWKRTILKKVNLFEPAPSKPVKQPVHREQTKADRVFSQNSELNERGDGRSTGALNKQHTHLIEISENEGFGNTYSDNGSYTDEDFVEDSEEETTNKENTFSVSPVSLSSQPVIEKPKSNTNYRNTYGHSFPPVNGNTNGNTNGNKPKAMIWVPIISILLVIALIILIVVLVTRSGKEESKKE